MPSAVEPHDAEEIRADQRIIRRINPKQHVVWDKNKDCSRVSSKAFKPSSGPKGGMSVDIEAQIIEDGHNPQKYVTTPVFTGSVAFCAGEARALGLWVGYDPLPDNPYHGEVWNSDRDRPNRFRRGQERGLHNAATWYVRLEGIEIR